MLLPLREGAAGGTDPQLQAASVDGDTAAAGGRTYLLFRNTGATARVATLESFYAPEPGAVAQDVTVALPGGATRLVGPLSSFPNLRNPADGNVHIGYDNNADVTLAHVGSI